ncbi:MAG: glycosyltransferase family 2 protein [Gemmobacter sp.]|jgi:hypothetical protein|nr:glycosyltransferase family 2 protein [Gemmobacter sp.]
MRIVSVTSVRDEGPFLLEWIAWHRLLGVSDFLIFSNDCRDGTDRMLDALATAGVVEHLPHGRQAGKSIQWQALKSAWQHPLRKAADWMLISDLDEFPMIHAGAHRFADLLAALPEGTEAVALAWRLFGNAGIAGFADRPVTAQFLHSAPAEMLHPIAASYFKTLFRPAAFRQPGVHRPAPVAGRVPVWVDGSGRPLPASHAENDGILALWRLTNYRHLAELHHYSLRSLESFLVKTERGLPNRGSKNLDLQYWVERNYNATPNAAALALQVPLAEEMARLRALPGLAVLHDAACTWHQQKAQALLRQPESYRLYAACQHVPASAVLPASMAINLLRLRHAIQTSGQVEADPRPA